MLELFLNPFSMMVGAALISSPIIIHLINRMRFKRIPWAAMEFLLKAHRKSRRKMIIEQLILLLLRILMVLLIALLLGRFLGFDALSGEDAKQSTHHIIIIDDTPSMTDFRREDGEAKDTLSEARRLIQEKIATPASQAGTPQTLEVIRLSETDAARNFGRLNASTLDELKNYLNDLKPSPRSIHLTEGLRKAQKLFAEVKNSRAVLHVVSDYRAVDWSQQYQQSMGEIFEELKKGQTSVFVLDVAHPNRTTTQNTPLAHDNLAIVDLRSETRIAAYNQTVEFQVFVANYSNNEQKNVKVDVRLNGQNRDEAAVVISTLPPNEITSARFTLTLDEPRGRSESEEARRITPFQVVTAHLPAEQAGLQVDNFRYTVLELRKRVPLLLIEGRSTALRKGTRGDTEPIDKSAETFHLYKIFAELASLKGYYDVQVRTVAELESANLRNYLAVYICGVPKFSEKALKNLEDYVEGGGGLGFFMSPDIKSSDAKFYNDNLWKEGKGLFPGGMELKPKNDGIEDDKITPSKFSRRFSGQMQILPRDKYHPALDYLYNDGRRGLSDGVYNNILRFAVIDRYFILNRLQWKNQEESVQELLTLARIAPMSDFTAPVEALMKRIPLADEKFAGYEKSFQGHISEIRKASLSNEPLYTLVQRFEAMLADDGDKASGRPSLRTFWQMPENADLLRDMKGFIDQIRYGDPLYVAKKYGRGRVVVCGSSASAWNEDGPYMAYFPPLMISLNRYLSSASSELNLSVGQHYEMSLDENLYQNKVRKTLITLPEDRSQPGVPAPGPTALQLFGTTDMPKKNGRYQLDFGDANVPGVYILEFAENAPTNPNTTASEAPTRYEYKALAYNLDSRTEGDLRRTSREDLRRTAGTENIFSPAEADTIGEKLSDKRSDLSETPWLYLVLLILLILEQAMAVRLSFHMRANDPGNANVPVSRTVVAA